MTPHRGHLHRTCGAAQARGAQRLVQLTLVLLALWAGPAALAQGAEPELASAATEQVTVSGKRLGPARARPANTVFDADELRARGTVSLEALLAGIPGVQPNAGEPGQSLPTLRGIGTSTSSELLGTQQATTGLYVDEVPLTSPFGFVGTPDLTGFTLQRLELLRGPQGVLYGSASLGGAIHYLLGRPARGQAHGGGEAGVALPSTGGMGTAAQAWLDRAAPEAHWALRLEGFVRRTPGDIHNLGTQQADANSVQRQGVRAALRWWAGGGTVVDADVLQQRQQRDDTQAVSPDRNLLQINTPTASSQRDRFSLARLQVAGPWRPGVDFTAITAWWQQQATRQTDLTRSSAALGQAYGPALGLPPLPELPLVQSLTRQPLQGQALSQELRLASQGAAGQPRWLAGLLVQGTRHHNNSESLAPGGAALWGPAGFLLPQDQFGALVVQARTRETAVFGELQWPGPSGLTVNMGGRAYRTQLAYDATFVFLGNTTSAAPKTHDQGFTPKLGVDLTLGRHSLHATVSGGYRFGGANFNPPALTPYRSDRLTNHELGLRLRPAGTLQLDLTAFMIDWRDAQVSALVGGAAPAIGVANVGRARSTGLEAAGRWQGPAGLQLSGSLAHTDAQTLTPVTTAAAFEVPAGARLPGTARWQTQGRLSQDFAAGAGWQGRAVVSHSWVGRRAYDIEGTAAAPGHSQVDLRLSLSRGPWELVAQLDNLRDTRGVTGATVVNRPGIAAFTDWYLTPPRRLALSVRHAL